MTEPANHTTLAAAAVRLFEADLALSDARQSGVTEWIVAASDRLHEAALGYAEAQRSTDASRPALTLAA